MTSQTSRTSEIQRETRETKISLTLNLDGEGKSKLATGIGFFDHMLELFARHAVIDLAIQADGDLHVDQHHTVEDVGICLGQAIDKALGDRAGIQRYGTMSLPMEESLANVAVDLGGRYFLVFNAPFNQGKIGEFDTELVEEFWRAVALNARCNLHVNVAYGTNNHHISEAIFKATARAMRQAMSDDDRMTGVPSTKGSL